MNDMLFKPTAWMRLHRSRCAPAAGPGAPGQWPPGKPGVQVPGISWFDLFGDGEVASSSCRIPGSQMIGQRGHEAGLARAG